MGKRIFIQEKSAKGYTRRQFLKTLELAGIGVTICGTGFLAGCSNKADSLYPLAQKCCPVKFFLRPKYSLAIWMALLPLMKPTTCDTEYLGGMEISM